VHVFVTLTDKMSHICVKTEEFAIMAQIRPQKIYSLHYHYLINNKNTRQPKPTNLTEDD